MNLLLWNVRGLGRGEKCITIRNLIRMHKVAFLGLVETKHRNSFQSRVRRMWGNDSFDWCESLASETSSGGLLAIWDPTVFCAAQSYVGDRWIVLEGVMVKVNYNCCIGFVYGPCDIEGRSIFFESIRCLLQNINKPLLVMGDFNEVLKPSERLGQIRYDRGMRVFGEWVQELQLVDVPLHGIRFTWVRNESQSKLDRCLCTSDWIVQFPELRLVGLQRGPSDHNPILLTLENAVNWGPKPFRLLIN